MNTLHYPLPLTAEDLRRLEAHIDELASEAALRCGQSHDAYVRFFSEAVDEEFGDVSDELWAVIVPLAEKRDYCSAEELAQADEEMAEQGYCQHGLTFWTCPAGCFE